jgi:preprotein translocase subunit YajC
MNALYLLSDAGSNTTANPLNNILSFLPMVLIIGAMVVFMFISSRKQRKQEKEIADMRNNIAVGDEITTIGGIIGKVVSVKEETCVIETSRDGTKIRILKSAISRVDVKAEDSID